MSKMKLLYALLPAFLMAGQSINPRTRVKKLSQYDLMKLKEFQKEKVKNVLVNRGVKEFTIDGYTVMARDEANAIRKINKLKSK